MCCYSHRNAAVRTTVARLLAYEVERIGPSRALSGQKDITDRLLPAAAKLAQEGSLETRLVFYIQTEAS